MKFRHVIKIALAPILVLTCTACASTGPSSPIDVSEKESTVDADRPCSSDLAYFDGVNAKPASINCSEVDREEYLISWEKGLLDARASNERYISNARDVQLRALDDLNTTENSESRTKAERLFNQMNIRISVLNKKNDNLDALLSTVASAETTKDAMLTATIDEEPEARDN